MKTFAFKNRLFITYTAVITLVVALFSVVLVATTADMNRTTELYHQQEIYKGNLSEIEAILRQMDRLAAQVVSNNEILGSFIPLYTDRDASNYFSKNLIDAIRVGSLLSSINGTDNYAARISLFNRGGDYVSTGTLFETPEKIEEMLASPVFYDGMMTRLQSDGRDCLVLDFHPDHWSNNPSMRLLSLFRTLSSYTANVYGLVEIQVGTNVFDRFPFWVQGERPEYLLLNRQGEVVYPAAAAEGYEALTQALLTVTAAGPGITVTESRVGREDVLLMTSPVEPSDLLFVRIVASSALMAPYVNGYVMTILASLVLLVCLVLVINYLAIRITRPLGSLARTVGNVNLQNMRQAIEATDGSYTTSELNALSRAFRGMLTRLDRAVSMEIQAHMRALQSQMNPHFLYNMLSVIIESSEEEGDQRTVSMCLKLSSMLRYIADYEGDTASLAEEVRHARNYLDLMKDRYEDQFTYGIEMDEAAGEMMVPKMIIQPLAENCFNHGFKDCRPPWHIQVEVRREGEGWRLAVRDNGSGITGQAIADVKERVGKYSSDVATNYQTLKLGGMGLVNTLMRLSLFQNDEIDFSIGNVPEGGTIIEIGGTPRDTGIDR